MTIEAQHSTSEEQGVEWWALAPDDVIAQAKTEGSRGLAAEEAEKRLAEVGPNALQSAPPPSVWRIALSQVLELMTLMLIAVNERLFEIGLRKSMAQVRWLLTSWAKAAEAAGSST